MISPGSSPLARGLPIAIFARRLAERIIPARAGFTPGGGVHFTEAGDHPRSRGVYPTARAGSRPDAGSSPLARGLPYRKVWFAARRRIIPARAGFTATAPQPNDPPTDHPRSRGVYIAFAISTLTDAGSSPLARGLLPAGDRPIADRRIIPARAGFTRALIASDDAPEDHPRSRGVYRAIGINIHSQIGSSPLARGLLLPTDRPRCGGRIIPARAGFTGAPRGAPSRTPDHPRSRGVYPSSRRS